MSANVALTETFDQWRVKTNELLVMTQTDGSPNFVKLTNTTDSSSNTTGSIMFMVIFMQMEQYLLMVTSHLEMLQLIQYLSVPILIQISYQMQTYLLTLVVQLNIGQIST